MKLRTKHIIYILAAMFGLTTLWACEDDFNPDMGGALDGSETTVPVMISFDAETAVDVTSRALNAQPGTAIQDINSFWMVIYNADGSLYRKLHIRENGSNITSAEVSNISYTGGSDNRLPEEGDLDDDAAGRLQFDLKLPASRYYIYGVANVADFDRKDISTPDRLKSIECAWDSTSIARNSEMFGIFSIGQNRGASDSSPIAVRTNNGMAQQLHCWLKRVASKVTIAFDGSELYDNVEVYIDTIMVCDVPKKCALGIPNHPGMGDDEETRLPSKDRYTVDNGLYRVGGIDVLQKPTSADLLSMSPQRFYHVCNSSHAYGGVGDSAGDGIDKELGGMKGDDPAVLDHKHAHTSRALYFYENLQGTGKDKKQSLDGTTIWKPNPQEDDLESGWKDGKAYGTYIEVRGYYRNTAIDGTISSGWIRYRFMLGQDAETNYDALRNTHYQVTLKLRGYGNDYDWHIDYKEDTGIYMTSPQFISYLYNKSMYATVKIVGEMDESYGLQAKILDSTDNNYPEWGPWGDNKANVHGVIEYPDPSNVKINNYDLYPKKNALHADAKGAHTSFLSLTKTTVLRIEPDAASGMQSWQIDETEALQVLKDNYNKGGKGERTYAANSANVPADDAKGRYTLQETRWKNGADGKKVAVERIYRIPLYTRAKELVTKTGFTGNNPYVAYPRKMTVQFSAYIKNKAGEPELQTFDLDVIQVRRIVNPKGIWRPSGSTEKFAVTLMRKPKDDDTEFVSFNSVGKWSAEIISESDPIISLSSTAEGSGMNSASQTNVRRVEGEDEHPISFDVNFNGANSGYAIVRVRYHNYTCEHDIFCWVGTEPVQLDPKKNVWWRHTNVYRFESDGTAVFADSPLQEGSLFRRGSLTAITPEGGPVNNWEECTNPTLNVLKAGSTTKTRLEWSKCVGNYAEARFKDWTIANDNERIADCEEDYYNITSRGNELDFPIKKAYGVLYGPGATAPATLVNDAYGYDSESGETSTKGMLGVFVYNSNTCGTMFMPMGKSTHGRRKGIVNWNPNPKDGEGTMRYASRAAHMGQTSNITQPLFQDLYRRPGALYWCKKYITDENIIYLKDDKGNFLTDKGGKNKVFNVARSSSFDINFFSMGFEGFSNSSIQNTGDNATRSKSDACFIRTVLTKEPTQKSPPPLDKWLIIKTLQSPCSGIC